MKEIRNNYDYELAISNVDEAKKYFFLDNEPDTINFNEELKKAETLEEIVMVLNKYTDLIDNGSSYYVHEII